MVSGTERAASGGVPTAPRLPWRQLGWSERQAAVHLLDRLAFGPRPGEAEEVLAMGVDTWVAAQLTATLPESAELGRWLDGLSSLELEVQEFAEVYPYPADVLRQAREAGVVSDDFDPNSTSGGEGSSLRRAIYDFGRERGYRLQRQLIGELLTQKLMRAVLSRNQLVEVLTDFWFNHFNVSRTDNQARVYILPFERDAIRPFVLGRFRGMLGATAHHPAMLLYLDNAQSTAAAGERTTLDVRGERGRRGRRRPSTTASSSGRPQGLNENYARELMELHTLGVDGGYTQDDVEEVARAFTGWTVYPPSYRRQRFEDRLERALRADLGFVREDAFLFRADAHDAGKKVVLGRKLDSGRGVEDGEEVLDQLAQHASTARHLATKLAVRFIADQPPATVVERLTDSFEETGGDLRAVMVTLVESPEFWDPALRHSKIKSPFEFAVSALRGLGAQVGRPRATLEWIERMGQPLYAYQAPTGFPDSAEQWVSGGALLYRMNFGLELAAGEVPGVRVDLAALNDHREPESLSAALEAYGELLMPDRDLADTVRLLAPLVADAEVQARLRAAEPETEAPAAENREEQRMYGLETTPEGRPTSEQLTLTHLERVVGLLLGSPGFQRR